MFCFARTALWPLGWREEGTGSTDFWAVATVEGPSTCSLIPQKSYRSRHPPPAIPISTAVEVTG